MIQIYDAHSDDYEINGTAVLHPTACTVTEEAGGNYSLSLTHPLDTYGIWKAIQPGAVIKVPVPALTTQATVGGGEARIYQVLASTPIRAKAQEPHTYSYPAWEDPRISKVWYTKGSKVSYGGYNWEASQTPSEWEQISPPTGGSWTKVSNKTAGGAVLQNMLPGDEVYWLYDYDSKWFRVASKKGIEGYILRGKVEYSRTIEVEPVAARTVRSQLFRVTEVTVDSGNRTVSASAMHVSYDLKGNMINACVITNQSPATALALIRNSLCIEVPSVMGTNLTVEQDGLFSGDLSRKNGVQALIDPDSGFLTYYKAKLVRDNWDIFIYRNEETNRGVCLAYGKNLTGVKWSQSVDDLVTKIMPVAKDAADEDLFLDEKYVDSPIAEYYPVQRVEILTIDKKIGDEDPQGDKYNDVTLRDYMRAEANKRYEVDNCDKAKIEVTVQFTLLGDTEEYRQYRGLEQLYLYDTVAVKDPTVGLDRKLQISRIVWDCIQERYSQITLGDVFEYATRAIAGYELSDRSITYKKLSPEALSKLKG